MEAEAVKGKEMMKCCPSSVCGFSLLMCPHPRITYILTPCSSPHHTPFLSALFLAVPTGEEVSLSLYPCKHLGGPRKAALQGDSHRSLSSHPQSRYKVRNPVRPPHAASSNHPSRQLPAACVAFVTPPGLPCPFACHITACV